MNQDPPSASDAHSPHLTPNQKRKGALGSLMALVFLLLNFGKWGLLILKGSKFAGTSISMLLTVGVYALFWGWKFALGFVILLWVHEMGHVLQLKREGVPASAPMFIPFVGAFVMMKDLPKDAAAEARVGLAGPILGTIGVLAAWALAVAAGGLETNTGMLLLALTYTGALLNLFNLLPVSPLDGGRAMAAVSPWAWLIGLISLVGLPFIFGPNPILILIILLGGFETIGRFRRRKEEKAYYTVSPRDRKAVLLTYLALAAGLVYIMSQTLITIPS